jgi:hypothetical protein
MLSKMGLLAAGAPSRVDIRKRDMISPYKFIPIFFRKAGAGRKAPPAIRPLF